MSKKKTVEFVYTKQFRDAGSSPNPRPVAPAFIGRIYAFFRGRRQKALTRIVARHHQSHGGIDQPGWLADYRAVQMAAK